MSSRSPPSSPHELVIDVREVAVDHLLHRVVEAVDAVLGADVEDVRPRRRGVHGLDVERLLAVPATGFAQFGRC